MFQSGRRLDDVGLGNGAKMLLIGTTKEQRESFLQREKEALLEQEKRARAKLNAARPREEKVVSDSSFGFGKIEVRVVWLCT